LHVVPPHERVQHTWSIKLQVALMPPQAVNGMTTAAGCRNAPELAVNVVDIVDVDCW
jgi:hypothetical protein